eukprot:scaffold2808_cov255-Pinguiococcus_pyrenoidosus.AAC.4
MKLVWCRGGYAKKKQSRSLQSRWRKRATQNRRRNGDVCSQDVQLVSRVSLLSCVRVSGSTRANQRK